MSHGGGGGYRGSGPLPGRWLNCPRKSDGVIADRFVAFKTPLDEKFDDKMSIEKQWAPETLLQLYNKDKRQKMTLWIDLTNTSRFYDRRIVERFNCEYVKMQCRGHGETPTPMQTRAFIELVDSHVHNHPTDLVGVHCTHGFNRTGFLVVSYMVDRLDYSVAAALMEFSKMRPPGIYKQDYIDELFKRYEADEDEEDIPRAPPRPDWCEEEEDEEREEEDEQQRQNYSDEQNSLGGGHSQKRHSSSVGGGERSAKVRRIEMVNPNATFMEGIDRGIELWTDQAKVSELHRMVQVQCHWTAGGFPGSQPVSMDRSNINLLRTKPYRVSWKADGTRYMMLIVGENQIYFFGRDFQCFRVSPLRFVRSRDLHQHLENTLLDGEMVIDRTNGVARPRYLVYDIIHFEGRDVGSLPFDERLDYVKKEVVFARYEAMKHGMINKVQEPFSVAVKDFWDVTAAEALLGKKFCEKLTHEPDGLIFQPAKEPYVAGQCDEVLKWKPVEMNSIDFRLKIVTEEGEG